MNYLKEYYKSADQGEKRYNLAERLSANAEKEMKVIKEIKKLQMQLNEKQLLLSQTIEEGFFDGFTKAYENINLAYDDKNGNAYLFELESGAPTERTAKTLCVGKMNSVIYILKGYQYETATLIINRYTVGIKPDKSFANVRFDGAVLVDFIGHQEYWFDAKSKKLSEDDPRLGESWRVALEHKDKEFIDTLFSCDYQGNMTLDKLYISAHRNKSFEIILKTAPAEIVDILLDKVITEAIPCHKILKLEPAIYEQAKDEELLSFFLDIEDYRDRMKLTDTELLDFLRNSKRYQEEMDFYKVNYTAGWRGTERLANTICTLYFASARYGRSPLFENYYTINKFQDYVCTEVINQGYGSIIDFTTELFDYLDMCRAQNVSPTLYSSYLKQTHDVCMRNHNIEVENNKEIIFKQRYENFKKWKKGNYMVVAPKCTSDLIREGDNLNHCVASYIKRVIDDTCKIFFLRKEEDKSLITFEVNDDRIVQVRGAHNRRPTQSEVEALKKFCEDRQMSYRA